MTGVSGPLRRMGRRRFETDSGVTHACICTRLTLRSPLLASSAGEHPRDLTKRATRVFSKPLRVPQARKRLKVRSLLRPVQASDRDAKGLPTVCDDSRYRDLGTASTARGSRLDSTETAKRRRPAARRHEPVFEHKASDVSDCRGWAIKRVTWTVAEAKLRAACASGPIASTTGDRARLT